MADKKKIVGVKPNGEVSWYSESISDIERHYPNLSLRNIRRSLCSDTRRAYGLRWMLADKYMEIYFSKGIKALSYDTDNQRDIHGRFAKGSAMRKGKKPFENMTEEWKEQMRERMSELAKRRRADTNDNFGKVKRKGRPILDLTTGKVYESGLAWSRDTGLPYGHITRAIKCHHKISGHQLERIDIELYNKLKKQQEDESRRSIEAV